VTTAMMALLEMRKRIHDEENETFMTGRCNNNITRVVDAILHCLEQK